MVSWKQVIPWVVFEADGLHGRVMVERRGREFVLTQTGSATLCNSFGELALVCLYDTPAELFDRDHRGERNPSARLTAAEVAEIRSRYRPNVRGLVPQLAREYGVTRRTIQLIVSGRRWNESANCERVSKPAERSLPGVPGLPVVSPAPDSHSPPLAAEQAKPVAPQPRAAVHASAPANDSAPSPWSGRRDDAASIVVTGPATQVRVFDDGRARLDLLNGQRVYRVAALAEIAQLIPCFPSVEQVGRWQTAA